MRIPFVAAVQCFLVVVFAMATAPAQANTDPIKVFILAGQSNMVGYGSADLGNNPLDPDGPNISGGEGSLRWLVENQAATYGFGGTNPLVDSGGNWLVRSDVNIHAQLEGIYGSPTNPGVVTTGGHSVGFGRESDLIGPEYGFGQVVGDAFDEDVLIIKVAKGGTSLFGNWRSPDAVTNRGGNLGDMWQQMTDTVSSVLTDFDTVNPGRGYEIAGFGWHQGVNDQVAIHNVEYEANLADLITSVRDAYGDDLPFVIGTTGLYEPGSRGYSVIELAQLAMLDEEKYPEFVGNVDVIDTNPFWRSGSESPVESGQGHHWNRNGLTYYDIGTSMGDAMVSLVPEPSSLMFLGIGGLALLRRRHNPSTL